MGEHLGDDLVQGVEQEVHRPVGLIASEAEQPSIAIRWETHVVAASFEPGARARWATSANTARRLAILAPAARGPADRPRRSHSRPSVHVRGVWRTAAAPPTQPVGS